MSGHHNQPTGYIPMEKQKKRMPLDVITGYTHQQSRSTCIFTQSDTLLQMMDSLAQGGPPGEAPPNMLASIQSYLDRTEELMQNPTVLLPSLPDPPAPGDPLLPSVYHKL